MVYENGNKIQCKKCKGIFRPIDKKIKLCENCKEKEKNK